MRQSRIAARGAAARIPDASRPRSPPFRPSMSNPSIVTSGAAITTTVPPPLPSWGLMIAEAKDYMFFSPWLIVIPGVALFVLVLGINLLGDGLRDQFGARSE